MALLEKLYTGDGEFYKKYENKSDWHRENVEKLKNINYETFLQKTRAVMMVTGCRSYIAVKEDSKCQGQI